MIRNISILFFLVLTLFVNAEEDTIPEYERYVDELVKTFALEMKNDLNLYCVGDGGRMPRDVEEIAIDFSINRRATLDEARKMEVYATEKLLQKINAHEKIRPFLREYPFTPARVGIRITFDDEFNAHYSDGTIAYMNLARGKIFYSYQDPIAGKLIDIHKESYEDALKLIGSTPLKLEDVRQHQPFPYENDVDKLFDDFVKEAEKKWDLYFLSQGGKLVNGIEEIAIKFVADKQMSLEKARKLHIEVTERLQEIINANTALRPHLKESPFPIKRIKVCIHFQKRNYEYYKDGAIAIVKQENGQLNYFTVLPQVGAIISVSPEPTTQESYEDAKKLVNKNASTKS
jgi:hypothetical protein